MARERERKIRKEKGSSHTKWNNLQTSGNKYKIVVKTGVKYANRTLTWGERGKKKKTKGRKGKFKTIIHN
jgi:hypothetical protein